MQAHLPGWVGKYSVGGAEGRRMRQRAIGPRRWLGGLLFWAPPVECMQLYAGSDIKVPFSSCFFLVFGSWVVGYGLVFVISCGC